MQRTAIPHTALKMTLSGLRLPISAFEGLSGQRGNSSWPPAVAFEGFEALVKQFFGSILRDEELVEEGRVQQAKVAELRLAVELDVQAEQVRAIADTDLRAERSEVAERRREANARANRKNLEIDRERHAAEEREKQRLDHQAAIADRAAQTRDKRIAAADRQARLTRAEEEAAALEQERSALEATRVAGEVADALDEQKAERKAN